MKKVKYPINQEDFLELKEMGYEVHQFEPWHFRIKKSEKRFIDIFPTTRVWCMYEAGQYVGKGEYVDMIDIVETKLDKLIYMKMK